MRQKQQQNDSESEATDGALSMEFVEYKSPKTRLLERFSDDSRNNFEKEILLECQGESVCLSGDMPMMEAAIAFSLLRDVSPEILVEEQKNHFAIYEHPRLKRRRPFETEAFAYPKRLASGTDVPRTLEEMSIDLNLVWEKSLGNTHCDRVESALQLLADHVKPVRSVRLVVSRPIPISFALAVQYSLLDSCDHLTVDAMKTRVMIF
jgi:hypothetical protein